VEWYLNNRDWLENCVSGEYAKYYEKNYSNR
jgi:dTDP-glucose 4,6-dehydratase